MLDNEDYKKASSKQHDYKVAGVIAIAATLGFAFNSEMYNLFMAGLCFATSVGCLIGYNIQKAKLTEMQRIHDRDESYKAT